ncbi:YceI family protein, partial [Streptomyces caeruleatus]
LHLGVSNIKGTIKLNSASIEAVNEDFTESAILLEADMNSIDTDNDKRDAHLKTADFFDSAKFPTISFQSTSFKKDAQDYV